MATYTIIKDDKSIAIDGVGAILSSIDLPANVHAIQWYGSTGSVEYNDGTVNLTISNMNSYTDIIAAGQAVIDAKIAADNTAASDAATAKTALEATYAWKRINDETTSYASIGDQLDQQYKDAVNGTTTWKDAIAAVKAAHPKP